MYAHICCLEVVSRPPLLLALLPVFCTLCLEVSAVGTRRPDEPLRGRGALLELRKLFRRRTRRRSGVALQQLRFQVHHHRAEVIALLLRVRELRAKLPQLGVLIGLDNHIGQQSNKALSIHTAFPSHAPCTRTPSVVMGKTHWNQTWDHFNQILTMKQTISNLNIVCPSCSERSAPGISVLKVVKR
jgi:hypothetical protein